MSPLRLLAVIALCAIAAPRSVAQSQPPTTLQSSVVGTWLLESIVDTLPDGSVYYWMGQRPVGVIMYDAAGHVAVQFMRDPRATLSTPSDQATPVELRAAYDGYYAYFGRYHLMGDSVTHFVEASHRPNEVGVTYRRAVRIVGDRLFISLRTQIGSVPHQRVLTWRRAG